MFSKRAAVKAEISFETTRPCDHKWKSFGIFRTTTTDGKSGTTTLKITKLYGCIWCKQANEQLLYQATDHDPEEIERILAANKESLNIELQAVVRERLADFQLVDEEYLAIARSKFPGRGY